jgi:type II secretory pathway component PulF
MLDLSFIKTGSLACWIMAVLFTYGIVMYHVWWYTIGIVVIVPLGYLLYLEEVKIRRYEADKLVEKAKIESDARIGVEKERTNRSNITNAVKTGSKVLDFFKKL